MTRVAVGAAAAVALAMPAAASGAVATQDICVETFDEIGRICTKDVGPYAAGRVQCVLLADGSPSATVACLPDPYPWIPPQP